MPLSQKVKMRFPSVRLLQALGILIFALTASPIRSQEERKPSFGEQLLKPLVDTTIDDALLKQAKASDTVVTVTLSSQTLSVTVGGKSALKCSASSGRKTNPTPVGDYKIKSRIEKVPTNGYGNFVDSKNRLLVAGVYQSLDPAPTGAKFVAVPQKHVLQLDSENITILSGHVRSSPATNGSIVVSEKTAKILYQRIPDGAAVRIVR